MKEKTTHPSLPFSHNILGDFLTIFMETHMIQVKDLQSIDVHDKQLQKSDLRQIGESSFWGNGDLAEVDTNMVLT